jgi:ankyrin repeat protein
MQSNADTVRLLLEQPGIQINAQDSEGRTALTAATSEGHPEIAQLLREHGAK